LCFDSFVSGLNFPLFLLTVNVVRQVETGEAAAGDQGGDGVGDGIVNHEAGDGATATEALGDEV
jgi:hypothetical protein